MAPPQHSNLRYRPDRSRTRPSRKRSSSCGSCSPTRRSSGKRRWRTRFRSSKSQASDPPPPVESAGRVGARLGKVSELTIIVPLAPGGAKRLRAFLRLLGGNLSQGADKVGTLHDMRFVFFDNDTRLLFATAFDGDWDAYIDDFVAKIPDYLDIINSAWDGWPGIRHPGREGLSRQAPDHGGGLVRRLSGSDGGGDPPAQAHRQGGRRIPRQGWLRPTAARSQAARKEKAAMATQTATANRPKQDSAVEQKIQKLREIYADAPEIGENGAGECAPRDDVAGGGSAEIRTKAPAGSASVRARSRS